LLICSNSERDLINIPRFFVAIPDVSTGLISIAMYAGLLLYSGSLIKNTPGILVAFLSQSLPSFKN